MDEIDSDVQSGEDDLSDQSDDSISETNGTDASDIDSNQSDASDIDSNQSDEELQLESGDEQMDHLEEDVLADDDNDADESDDDDDDDDEDVINGNVNSHLPLDGYILYNYLYITN